MGLLIWWVYVSDETFGIFIAFKSFEKPKGYTQGFICGYKPRPYTLGYIENSVSLGDCYGNHLGQTQSWTLMVLKGRLWIRNWPLSKWDQSQRVNFKGLRAKMKGQCWK